MELTNSNLTKTPRTTWSQPSLLKRLLNMSNFLQKLKNAPQEVQDGLESRLALSLNEIIYERYYQLEDKFELIDDLVSELVFKELVLSDLVGEIMRRLGLNENKAKDLARILITQISIIA